MSLSRGHGESRCKGMQKKVATFNNDTVRVRARAVGMKDARDVRTRSWSWIYVRDVSRRKG